MAARLREVLVAQPLPNRVGRLTATVAGSSGAVMHHHFTFRPSAHGLRRSGCIRGLHPRIAQRMQLERLREFDLTRLPVARRGGLPLPVVARENPSDERLVALGQVRDLTPLRDDDGRLVALPAAEDIWPRASTRSAGRSHSPARRRPPRTGS